MRISGWCSDGCSSDLELHRGMVEADRGLVEQPEFGRRGGEAGERQATALAGRQQSPRHRRQLGEGESPERPAESSLRSPGTAAQIRPEAQVLRDAEDRLHGVEVAEVVQPDGVRLRRSEEHTSELQSLMRISYAVFCLKKK